MTEFRILKARASETDGIINFEDTNLPWGGYSLKGLENELRIKIMKPTDLINWIVDEQDDFEAFLKASKKMKYVVILFDWNWSNIAQHDYKHILSPGVVMGRIVKLNYVERLVIGPRGDHSVEDLLQGYYKEREKFALPVFPKPPCPPAVDVDQKKLRGVDWTVCGCEDYIKVHLLTDLDFGSFKQNRVGFEDVLTKVFAGIKYRAIVFQSSTGGGLSKRQSAIKEFCQANSIDLKIASSRENQLLAMRRMLKTFFDKLIGEIQWFA